MPVSGLDESAPRRARIGGAEFAWIEASPGQTGEPPRVWIHGFTGHRDDFIGVVPELARKRRVIAPDLRGHGDSIGIAGVYGWNFDQLVKDLIELLGADPCEQHLPRVRRITLANAEHHPHQENPRAWFEAVEAHLDDVDQAAHELAALRAKRSRA